MTGVSVNPNTEREEKIEEIRSWRDQTRGREWARTPSGENARAWWSDVDVLLADRDLLARALRLASEEIANYVNADADSVASYTTPESVLAGLLREAAKL